MNYRIIPKTQTILADLQTPVGIYLKMRDLFPESVLLESSDYHSKEEAYSIIGISPMARFQMEGDVVTMRFPDGAEEKRPLEAGDQIPRLFKDFLARFEVAQSGGRQRMNVNGFFGYTSAETAYRFEETGACAPRAAAANAQIPAMLYVLYKFVITINHFNDELVLLENLQPGEESRMQAMLEMLENRNVSLYDFAALGAEESPLTDEDYKAMVRRGVAHCRRGDIFQIVLSRGFSRRFRGDDFKVYRALRSVNPSPYLFYFDFGAFRIFGSSPETQCRVHNGRAYIDPIAGTVRRTGNDEEDKRLAQLLLADPKENAEHVMLVDLARNDLSRSALDVKIDFFREIQYYSHVIHLVSRVSGKVPDGVNPLQFLAESFPAGTLSGAPKIRALQLIAEIETQLRGAYGGSIGYIGFDGGINHAITIRSFVSKDHTLFYQAGAGIVNASSDAGELEEVNHKVGALRRAIALAEELKN